MIVDAHPLVHNVYDLIYLIFCYFTRERLYESLVID